MSRRPSRASRPAPGVEVRHHRKCASRTGGACDCRPTYRASVHTGSGQTRIRRTFTTLEAAKLWRQDAQVDLRRGVLEAPKQLTVAEAAEAWVAGARSGAVPTRSGHPYKPSAVRGYEQNLRHYVLPALGTRRLNEVKRGDVQRLADRLVEEGLS